MLDYSCTVEVPECFAPFSQEAENLDCVRENSKETNENRIAHVLCKRRFGLINV